MKKGFEMCKLGDVLTIERGGSPRPIDKYLTSSPDGINWIKISDATASEKYIYETKEKITKEGLHKTRVVNEGDFILSNSMSFGRPYIMKTSGCIHDGWLVLKQKGKKIFDTEFLYYLLSSPFVFQQFNSKAAGSTVRNLNIALVSSVDVPIPPLAEQQRIVAILDEAFAAIAKAKANAERNLKNAKELFESYLLGVFEKKGEGWVEKKLSDVANLIDSLHVTPKYIDDGYPMVRVTDIKPGFLNLTKTKKVDKKTFEEFSKRHTPKIGDIVLSRVGSYGVSALVNTSELFCLGQNTVFIIPKIDSNYFYYFLNSPYSKQQLDRMVAGTTQPTISLKSIKEVYVHVPPLGLQHVIVQKLDAITAETKKLEAIYQAKINNLDELKKSILQKAFSGELTQTEVAS